ncbi:ankyrin repeat domain-containing protein [Saccharothrix saharensis]|uniref:ankyrin repeat domain-containing protein n=1 Tax=Saccharothrix saharensis TaxID=571190 RepID=UPI0036C62378
MRDEHPVIAAAEAGEVDRLAELLDTEPEAVNVRGWMGITPLIAATWKADSAAAVRLLLDRGADPLAVRTNGDGALHWAASGEVAKLVTTTAGLAARYLFDQTPLHVAVENGRADVVRVCLDAGADPAALDARGRTPLDLADDPRIARLLIEAGAPHRTRRSSTPLHDACRRAAADADWVPVVELLLEHGADPGVRDEFGELPSDLVGEQGSRGLRDRLNALVVASGRSVELGPGEVAVGPQERVAIHPARPEALTTMFSGTVLVPVAADADDRPGRGHPGGWAEAQPGARRRGHHAGVRRRGLGVAAELGRPAANSPRPRGVAARKPARHPGALTRRPAARGPLGRTPARDRPRPR